jgi:hypothetical protein
VEPPRAAGVTASRTPAIGRRREVAMLESDDDRIEVTGNQARAGVTGHHVRHVLVFGMLGAIGLVAAVYLYILA